MKTANIDWVFWIGVRRRGTWFRWFWTNRGANFFEIQAFGFCITLGMPWLKSFEQVMSTGYCRDANIHNLAHKGSFLVKRNSQNQ